MVFKLLVRKQGDFVTYKEMVLETGEELADNRSIKWRARYYKKIIEKKLGLNVIESKRG